MEKKGWKVDSKGMERTRLKILGIENMLKYGLPWCSSKKEFEEIIKSALKLKEGEWFETGYFRYERKPKTIRITPAFGFSIRYKEEKLK